MKSTPSDVSETKVLKSKDTAAAKPAKTVKAPPANAAPAKSTAAAKAGATKAAAGKTPSAKAPAKEVKAVRPVAAKKQAKAQTGGVVTKLVFDLHAMIETEAYYRAEQRGFAPGRELDDWLEAEQSVLNRLGQSGTQGITRQ